MFRPFVQELSKNFPNLQELSDGAVLKTHDDDDIYQQNRIYRIRGCFWQVKLRRFLKYLSDKIGNCNGALLCQMRCEQRRPVAEPSLQCAYDDLPIGEKKKTTPV